MGIDIAGDGGSLGRIPLGPRHLSEVRIVRVLEVRVTASTLSASSSVADPGALDRLGVAVRRVGADETAFAHREAEFNLIIVSIRQDPTAAQANVRSARDP